MSFDDLLNMEVRRFWFLNYQLERLRAEEQIFQMRTNGSLTSAEGFNATFDHYVKTLGEISVYHDTPATLVLDETKTDPEFGKAAFLAFKQKVGDNS